MLSKPLSYEPDLSCFRCIASGFAYSFENVAKDDGGYFHEGADYPGHCC